MRLKAKDIKPTRERLLAEQHGNCQICKNKIPVGKDRLDHDHTTGAIRSCLCDGCNRLYGKIESNFKRFCVDLPAFLSGIEAYAKLHATDQTGLQHPSHRTPEEKKALAKKRRQKKNGKNTT